MNQFYNNFFFRQNVHHIKYAFFCLKDYRFFTDCDSHNQLIFLFKNDHQIYVFRLY